MRETPQHIPESLDFWSAWEAPSPIERAAIAAVVRARDATVRVLPPDRLVSIYIKGSFVRRELVAGSDVDMVPIVRSTADEPAVFGVNGPDVLPVFVVPLSLEELESNALATPTDLPMELRASPDRFLRFLDAARCIHGAPLRAADFPVMSDIEAFRASVARVATGYIPAYRSGSIPLDPLLKEVVWLTELELLSRGETPKHSFAGIADAVRDPSHIVHAALRLRTQPASDADASAFLARLEEHLDGLRRSFETEKR